MARLIQGGSCVIAVAASGTQSMPTPSTKALPSQNVSPVTNAILATSNNAQAPGGIDAKPDRAAGEDRRAKIVPDRIADEARHRRDPIRHVAAADRAQREIIVERQRDVAGNDKPACLQDVTCRGRSQGDDDLVDDRCRATGEATSGARTQRSPGRLQRQSRANRFFDEKPARRP